MEECTLATQVWRLSAVDLSEISRNSVLQSSFEPNVKAFWIGVDYWKGGVEGNDIHRTNVPYLRVSYREAALAEEWHAVNAIDGKEEGSPLGAHPISPSRAFRDHASAAVPAAFTLPASSIALPPPPPPPPTVMSPHRGRNKEYEGAFPRLYGVDEARMRSTGNLTPSMLKDLDESTGSAPGSAKAMRQLDMSGASKPSDDDITTRLDAQQRLLEQAQAMALAAETRAEAAMRMNRYILIGCVVAVAVLALRR